jgi:Ca2+/Na+ antiporter
MKSGLAPSGDSVVHLIIADGVRRNGHRIPDRFPELLLSGSNDYPSFFHWLLSFLSKETLEQWEPFIGTFIEIVHNLFIFFTIYYFALKQEMISAKLVGFLGSVIFALTPLFIDHVGRVFLLSERPFGALLGTVFVFFGLQLIAFSDFWCLAGAGVASGIIFISSKFTVQAILFISLVFSLLAWTPKIWLAIVAGFLLISLISRGYALKVFLGHIRHSIFYKDFLLTNYLRPNSQYLDLFRCVINGISRPNVLIQAFRTNSLLKIFSMMPWVLVLFPLLLKNNEQVKSNMLFHSCFLWIISCIILVCVVSIKKMRFLGEPERYLEIGILPIAFLTSFFLIQEGSIGFWILFIVVAFYCLFAFWRIFSGARKSSLWDADQEKLCDWLREIEPSRILTIPLKTACFLVYRTHHKGLSILANISGKSQQRQFMELCPVLYPYANSNLKRLAKEYNLNFIIVHKPTLDSLRKGCFGITYDFSTFEKTYENSSYAVYGLKNVS